jgi:predicted tellurium resistance membrane protein TerC
LLDLVFSLDGIISAAGMTEHLPIMIVAVVIAVLASLLAATPLTNFINAHPTVVRLALGFLPMIGVALIAEDLGKSAEGIYLRSNGFLGPRRGSQHAGAAGP